MIPHRIEKLAKALAQRELDALIVTEPTSRYYLTGWWMGDSQPGELAFWVLADPEGTTILTGQSNVVEAREAASGSRIVGTTPAERGKNAAKIAGMILEAGYRRVGFDDIHLGTNYYLQLRAALGDRVELVQAADLVREIRAVKEPGEIDLLREAIRITDSAYMTMRDWITPGRTEREVAWFLEKYMREQGAEGLGFGTIVAAGPGGAVPHHEPTDRPIQPGEPVVLDFAALYHGYSADLTRTFCLGTPADDLLPRIYEAVIASLDAGIAALKVGDPANAASIPAAYEVESRGFPVSHPGGHGIGLQVHELPSGPMILAEDMIMTFEPGVYIPGWGGVRVEDDVLLTKSGAVILTTSTRQLEI